MVDKKQLLSETSKVQSNHSSSVGTFKDLPIQPSQIIKHPTVEALKSGERGIITSASVKIHPNGSFDVGGPVSNDLLRQYILFFDKIDIPSNNYIELGGESPEIQFLKSAGILRRTRIELYGSLNGAEVILDSQKIAFDTLDATNPGAWSIAQSIDADLFKNQEPVNDRGIIISLYDALLIPDKDVHFEDVLKFKSKRKAELEALRHHLDKIYQTIISSPDRDLAKLTEVEKLTLSISDYNKALKETQFNLTPSTLKANFSLEKAIATGAVVSTTGVNMYVATISGVVAGLDIKASIGLKRNRSQATPFRYISSINSELL